jgi:Fur family ferric uptake transcriptional regulator
MSCIAKMKEKGLKLTPQRRLVADILHDNTGSLTAEEIIACVQSRVQGVSKSTIYRTLELLEEAGCVYKSEVGDRLVYHHADEEHHHHLACSVCGKTIDCDEDLFTPLEKYLCEKYGFSINFKHISMKGLCADCGRKNK